MLNLTVDGFTCEAAGSLCVSDSSTTTVNSVTYECDSLIENFDTQTKLKKIMGAFLHAIGH